MIEAITVDVIASATVAVAALAAVIAAALSAATAAAPVERTCPPVLEPVTTASEVRVAELLEALQALCQNA